jgi:ribosomal protein S18 acetylase RimI-like enzyme
MSALSSYLNQIDDETTTTTTTTTEAVAAAAATNQDTKQAEQGESSSFSAAADIIASSYRKAPISNKTIFSSDFSFIGKTSLSRKPTKPTSANKANKTRKKTQNEQEQTEEEEEEEEEKNDKNEKDEPNKPPEVVSVRVYAVRMSRLQAHTRRMKNQLKKEFGCKRLHDLIHSACAMYNLCLPDIEPHHIYNCVCSRKSVTICVLKDQEQVQEEEEEEEEEKEGKDTVYGSKDNLEMFEKEHSAHNGTNPKGLFRGLFSDYEDKESEEEDDNEEEDKDDESDESESDDDDQNFTFGLKSFVTSEKKARDTMPNVVMSRSRILNNLIACATVERVNTYQQPSKDEWVIDLELMGVRRKYRGYGLGKYLIGLVQSDRVVGSFDALVTSADPDAVEFYEKYSFVSDAILNSKYAHIGDLWTNTTKMCYLPPYMSNSTSTTTGNEENDENNYINELAVMERDFKRWQKIMFSAYQTQAQIFYKFKQEILSLKAKLCAKNSLIEELKLQNDLLTRKNRQLRLQQQQQQDLNLTDI